MSTKNPNSDFHNQLAALEARLNTVEKTTQGIFETVSGFMDKLITSSDPGTQIAAAFGKVFYSHNPFGLKMIMDAISKQFSQLDSVFMDFAKDLAERAVETIEAQIEQYKSMVQSMLTDALKPITDAIAVIEGAIDVINQAITDIEQEIEDLDPDDPDYENKFKELEDQLKEKQTELSGKQTELGGKQQEKKSTEDAYAEKVTDSALNNVRDFLGLKNDMLSGYTDSAEFKSKKTT